MRVQGNPNAAMMAICSHRVPSDDGKLGLKKIKTGERVIVWVMLCMAQIYGTFDRGLDHFLYEKGE
jgi:hypothetical protein